MDDWQILTLPSELGEKDRYDLETRLDDVAMILGLPRHTTVKLLKFLEDEVQTHIDRMENHAGAV